MALDVVRGFALFGIFLMNVEFFSRPLADLDVGMPAGVQGLDYWAGWFVHVFVRGKFWTMFSLLFGMGFAVMLLRAEGRGAGFVAPYLRRTLALAVLGALHYVFLWAGDILLSYAMGAAMLVLVFNARPKLLYLLTIACIGIAICLGVVDQVGLAQLPWKPFAALGVPLLVLSLVAAALQRWSLEGLRNAGLALYLLPFLAMTIGSGLMLATPPGPQSQEQQQAQAKRMQEHQAKVAAEARVLAHGSYAEVVAFRVRELPGQVGNDAAFAVIVVGVFLLGAWFVRSGVMLDPAAHLWLFRILAWWCIPLGIGLSLVAAAIATTHVRGQNDAAFQFASGLSMLASLPASIGYVGALVLAMHGRLRRWVVLLAPAGRMALTNYLLQSLLGTLFFYGYGLAHWGMGRAAQIVFVLAVFGLQLLLSRWWLSRFRYGPLEWLWRAATYLRLPAFRIA